MWARLTSAVVWAVVAAAAAYWGLQLFARGPAAPAHAVAAPAPQPPAADWRRLFGVDVVPVLAAAEPAAPPPDARFQLIGVVAPRVGAVAPGVALIAVDGKPARAFRVGAAVDGETVLQAVQSRGASLGPRGGPVRVALQLPAAPSVGAAPALPVPGNPSLPALPQVAPMPSGQIPGQMAPPMRPPRTFPRPAATLSPQGQGAEGGEHGHDVAGQTVDAPTAPSAQGLRQATR